MLSRLVVFASFVVVVPAFGFFPLRAGVHRAERPIPGRYIVGLERGHAPPGEPTFGDLAPVSRVAADLGLLYGGDPGEIYRRVFRGFTVRTTRTGAARMAADPRVAWVEQDGWVRPAQGTQVDPPSWGVDRIDQRDLPLDGVYDHPVEGDGVHVFVVDSGIRSTHDDFGSRVDTVEAVDLVGDGHGTEDCFGHGTWVAGLAGGLEHGVAKDVILHPVRVLGCDGTGATSDVISAIEWVTTTYLEHQQGKPSDRWRAVANLSLEISAAPSSLNQALYTSIAEGVIWVAAAGNGSTDRCDPLTPVLGLDEVIVVGASDSEDAMSSTSNFGPCVDLFAPGVGVQTTGAGSDTETLLTSGTSMASPHVAGAAAMELERSPESTPDQVQDVLIAYATSESLAGVPSETVNLLLFTAF